MMKKLSIIITAYLLLALVGSAQSHDAAVIAYINKYRTIALEQQEKYGIPAPITLAQGIVESGAGRSSLTRNSHNHFGVKAHRAWKGAVHHAKDDEPGLSRFRVYSSDRESFEDHSRFLAIENRSRYAELFTYNILDYRSWAHGLKKKGYATAPDYAQSLIQYIERFQLYKLNGGVKLRPSSRQKERHIKVVRTIYVTIPDMDVIADDETTEEEEDYERVARLPYVREINGVSCQRIYPGETLSLIALENDLSKYDLLEYNEATSEDDFQEGDIVYLEQKKNKYNDPEASYVVQSGDTWHSISQRFGVKVSYLLKKNKKTYADKLEEGERLWLK